MAQKGKPGWSEILFRLSAFLWGFSFLLYFRQLLDNLFPFYRNFFPLSQFALVLFGIAFIAAARHRATAAGRWKKIVYSSLIICISLGGIYTAFGFFTPGIAYLYLPLPLTLLQLLLWYELARHAFSYQTAKIYLLAGALASLYAGKFLDSPYAGPALAALTVIMARVQRPREWQIAHERMLTLRQLLDFLRYLFLAQAFHASLGQNREYLLIVVLICAIGLIIPQLTRLFDTVRPHVQNGLVILPLIFIALAAVFNFVHYTYWGATAYALIAIWEGIYFARAHEIHLRREKILGGAALAAAFSGYYISAEWLQILLGILIALFLAGILAYIANAWRKTITALFGVAVAAWVISVQWKYSHSVTRDFFRPPPLRIHKPQLPDAGLILGILSLQKKSGLTVHTNMLPDELLEDEAWRGQNITATDANPAFLVLKTAYACAFRKENRIYFFDEKSLGIYSEPSALVALGRMLNLFGTCDIYLADNNVVRSVKAPGTIQQGENTGNLSISAEDAPRFLSLARAEKQRNLLSESQNLYEKVFSFYREDPVFLRELASLAAARGLIDRQIQVLENLIALRKDNILYDKKLLMELYAVRGNRKKSSELAFEILGEGGESPLGIYTFLQKLYSNPFDRTELMSLYQKIGAYQPKTELEGIRHAGLKRSVEDLLQQNPTYDRKFQDENHRQEFITFPE